MSAPLSTTTASAPTSGSGTKNVRKQGNLLLPTEQGNLLQQPGQPGQLGQQQCQLLCQQQQHQIQHQEQVDETSIHIIFMSQTENNQI